MSRLTIIVAATNANGIGTKNCLPWRLPKESKFFAQATSKAGDGQQNVVIMGRNTWESIPKKNRPLSNRYNIILSRNSNYDLGVPPNSKVALKGSLKSALTLLDESGADLQRAFIIGGANLYDETLALPLSSSEPGVDRILLTRILSPEFKECDTFFQDLCKENSGKWTRSTHTALQDWVGFEVPEGEQEEKGVRYEFQMWVRSTF